MFFTSLFSLHLLIKGSSRRFRSGQGEQQPRQNRGFFIDVLPLHSLSQILQLTAKRLRKPNAQMKYFRKGFLSRGYRDAFPQLLTQFAVAFEATAKSRLNVAWIALLQ